jgi:hypothetical protein
LRGRKKLNENHEKLREGEKGIKKSINRVRGGY